MSISKLLPTDVFDYIGKNAGIIMSDFDATTWTVDKDKILGATTGGISFTDAVTYKDFGEDIDNCPKNMLELKQVDEREITVSGTYISLRPEEIAHVIGAADYDLESNKVKPRDELKNTDFKTLWFLVDYGENSAIAIRLDNVLSTGGLQVTTVDNEKNQFAFTYTAHYSIDAQDVVPYEIFIKSTTSSNTSGTSSTTTNGTATE